MHKYPLRFLSITRALGCCSFQFIAVSPLIDPNLKLPKKLNFYGTLAGLFLLFLHFIRVGALLPAKISFYMSNRDFLRLTFHNSWVICYGLMLHQHYFYFAMSQEITQLVHGVSLLSFKLEKRYFNSKIFDKSRLFRIQALALACGNSVFTALFVGGPVFYMFRRDPWHVGSYVYLGIEVYFANTPEALALVLAMICDGWVMLWAWGAFIVHMYVNLMYLQTFSTTMHFLSNFRETRHDNIQILAIQLKTYFELRILTILYNESYGKHYIPQLKSTQGLFIVLEIFFSIRLAQFGGVLIVLVGIMAICFCGTILFVVADLAWEVHQISFNFCARIIKKKHATRSSLGRRMLRTYKVEAVKSGQFYDIHKMTMFTMLSMLSNVAASLLISTDFK